MQGIQFHLAQLSLRGRDIAGTCNVIFIIVILVYNILCDLISIVLQNIHIVCGRFLTHFLFQRISTQVLSISSVKQVHQGTNFRHCEIWEEDLLALARAFQ